MFREKDQNQLTLTHDFQYRPQIKLNQKLKYNESKTYMLYIKFEMGDKKS